MPVGHRLGAGFTTGFQQGQDRARQAQEQRQRSAAEAVRVSANAGNAPNQQLMQAPQASSGALMLPFSEEELQLAMQARLDDQLSALANEMTLPALDITRDLKPGQTLWALAKEDLGPGATNAQIQERAQQYMEVNGIADPRTLQVGQQLLVPTGAESVSATTIQAYAESDAELRQYYAEQAAAAQAAARAALGQSGAYPIDPITGLRAGPTIENAMALGLLGGTSWPSSQPTGTIGPLPPLVDRLGGIWNAYRNGQIDLGDAFSMAAGNISFSYRI